MEALRHIPDGVALDAVERRVGTVDARLKVLDLTDPAVGFHLDLAPEHLVGPEWLVSQAIAAAARMASFQGVLSPSAALAGAETLVVFRPYLDRLTVLDSRTISLANLLSQLEHETPEGPSIRV
jgi:hypothetical protein